VYRFSGKGLGGVFNNVNLHAYHDVGNNPVKYVDPDEREKNLGINGLEDYLWFFVGLVFLAVGQPEAAACSISVGRNGRFYELGRRGAWEQRML
jgi:hypothetical protein